MLQVVVEEAVVLQIVVGEIVVQQIVVEEEGITGAPKQAPMRLKFVRISSHNG